MQNLLDLINTHLKSFAFDQHTINTQPGSFALKSQTITAAQDGAQYI